MMKVGRTRRRKGEQLFLKKLFLCRVSTKLRFVMISIPCSGFRMSLFHSHLSLVLRHTTT